MPGEGVGGVVVQILKALDVLVSYSISSLINMLMINIQGSEGGGEGGGYNERSTAPRLYASFSNSCI